MPDAGFWGNLSAIPGLDDFASFLINLFDGRAYKLLILREPVAAEFLNRELLATSEGWR